jgi:hypothetical protein
MLKRYVTERDIGMHTLNAPQMKGAAQASSEALAQLAPKVQWIQSYVANDKTFCVYLAEDEPAIREHARLSGIPAGRIAEIDTLIDPTMAR